MTIQWRRFFACLITTEGKAFLCLPPFLSRFLRQREYDSAVRGKLIDIVTPALSKAAEEAIEPKKRHNLTVTYIYEDTVIPFFGRVQ
jgi:hypothetical protein